jgi:glycerate dehydrogenase
LQLSYVGLSGVLTETTAELAVALTLAAARRVAEGDAFMRRGLYKGWLPNLFVGLLLQNKTVGIIGAGRIGTAYARMMVEGHKMDLVYYDPYKNERLEKYVQEYGEFLKQRGERPVSVTRVSTVEEVLRQGDVRTSPNCSIFCQTALLKNRRQALCILLTYAIPLQTAPPPIFAPFGAVR